MFVTFVTCNLNHWLLINHMYIDINMITNVYDYWSYYFLCRNIGRIIKVLINVSPIVLKLLSCLVI